MNEEHEHEKPVIAEEIVQNKEIKFLENDSNLAIKYKFILFK